MRRFVNDVFLSDPEAKPEMLMKILIEANAKPRLQKLCSDCLNSAKSMFILFRKTDPIKNVEPTMDTFQAEAALCWVLAD